MVWYGLKHPGVCEVDCIRHLEKLRIFTVTADGTTSFDDLDKLITIVDKNEPCLPMSSLTLISFDCYSHARERILVRLLGIVKLQAFRLGGLMEELKCLRSLETLTKIVMDVNLNATQCLY